MCMCLCLCPYNIGEINAETRALLIENEVDYDIDGFPEKVMNELKDIRGKQVEEMEEKEFLAASDWKIPDEEFTHRLDIRTSRIFSIDPTTARDLDDALSITKTKNGNYRVGVHIADLTTDPFDSFTVGFRRETLRIRKLHQHLCLHPIHGHRNLTDFSEFRAQQFLLCFHQHNDIVLFYLLGHHDYVGRL